MCRADRARSRNHGSEFQSGFDESGPRARGGPGWMEFFMRGGGHGFGRHRGFGGRGGEPGGDEDGGGFGVRRPLRFLAHKLELDEKQVAELAKILDELKTERAQASVDDRRSLADFAEALSGDAFDAGRAASAGERRVASAAKLRDAVVKALGQIHLLLNPEQRGRLAYMIRTGVLGL